MITTLPQQIAQFIRWRDWGPCKVTILCSLGFYVANTFRLPFLQFVTPFFLFLLFASAQSALGFVLNEWGDRRLDLQQEKPNVFNNPDLPRGLPHLLFTIAIAILTGIPFRQIPGFLLLWGLWVLSATAYSIPPLRFKERGKYGLIISFFAQWTLPVLLVFTVFDRFNHPDMWLFALALTISGATLEIAHQRFDRERDSAAHAQTFAAGISNSRIDCTYAYAVVLDKIAIGVVAALVVLSLITSRAWWAYLAAAITALAYLILFSMTIAGALRALRGGEIQDPYYAGQRTFASLLHETLPNFLFPTVLILSATIVNPLYCILLIFFLFWRIVLGGADWRLPFRLIQRLLKA